MFVCLHKGFSSLSVLFIISQDISTGTFLLFSPPFSGFIISLQWAYTFLSVYRFFFFCKLELFCYSFCFVSYYTSSLRRFFVFPSPVHCCSVRFTIALAIGYSCFTFSLLFSVSIIHRKVFGFRPGSHFPSLLSHYWVSRCRMVDFVRNRFLSMV